MIYRVASVVVSFNFFLWKHSCSLGLSHTPRSDKSEIAFSVSQASTYETYVGAMETFLKQYDDGRQTNEMKYEDCGGKYKPVTDI